MTRHILLVFTVLGWSSLLGCAGSEDEASPGGTGGSAAGAGGTGGIGGNSGSGGTAGSAGGSGSAGAGGSAGGGGAACGGADLLVDPNNCGACGHDCLGGGCTSGVCGPALALHALDRPHGIATDATHLYWTRLLQKGGVMRAPLAGGPPEELADVGFTMLVTSVVVDDARVYWTQIGSPAGIGTRPKDGSGKIELLAPVPSPFSLVRDADSLYFGSTTGHVGRVSTSGGAPEALYQSDPGQGVLALAVGDQDVYVALQGTQANEYEDGSVVKIAKQAPHTAVVLASAQHQPGSLGVGGGKLYWSNIGDNKSPNGAVMRIDPNAPAALAEVLVPGLVNTRGIAWHEKGLYFVHGGTGSGPGDPCVSGDAGLGAGKLERVDAAGVVTTFAVDQLTPSVVHVGADAVYWSDLACGIGAAGLIWRIVP